MTAWVKVSIKPLTPLFFRLPGPMEAGVHGPGIARGSLSYPLPSTVAGALAALAVSGGAPKPSPGTETFSDTRSVLEEVLGSGFKLRLGLAESGKGRLYAYTGGGKLVELGALLSALEEVAAYRRYEDGYADFFVANIILSGDTDSRASLSLQASDRYGVALSRHVKSVMEGMLYRVSEIDYLGVDASIIAHILAGGGGGKVPEGIVKLGGRQGLAMVKVEEGGVEWLDLASKGPIADGVNAALMLVTPALSKTPLHKGAAVASDEHIARWMARAILPSRCGDADARIVYMPKGELEASVVLPGWSIAGKRPREPHYLLPAGTVILIKGATEDCLRTALTDGIGLHGDLGWGTVVAGTTHPPS